MLFLSWLFGTQGKSWQYMVNIQEFNTAYLPPCVSKGHEKMISIVPPFHWLAEFLTIWKT